MEKTVTPQYGFGFRGAVWLVVGMLAGTTLVSVTSAIVLLLFNINWQYTPLFTLTANALTFVGAILAFDLFVCRPTTGRKLNFNFSPTNVATYGLILPMMFGMMLIAESITAQIPTSGPFFGEYYDYFMRLMEQMTSEPAALVILAVFMAPLFEEIVFRGIIMKGMINDGVRPPLAIFVAALLFGLVHGNPWQFVGAVLLGCVLGLVYYKTKSLLLPILLHAFNNLCSVLLIFMTDKESFAEAALLPQWIIFAIGVILFTVFYLIFTKRYRVQYTEQ